MSKKKFNSEAISNELTGSSFFPAKKPEEVKEVKPVPVVQETVRKVVEEPKGHITNDSTDRTTETTVERANGTPNGRTVQRKKKRTTTRFSFEIYVDQIESLKQLRIQSLLEGEEFNGSAIIREALDLYFKRLRERSNGTTGERRSE